MTDKIAVLGIGNAIMDVIGTVPDTLLTEQDIVKGGMTLVDEDRALAIHAAIEAVDATQEIAGGSAANTLVGIAELGVPSAYIGKVKNDALGQRFTDGLRASGLRFETTPTTDGPATARCIIAVTQDGERSMSTFLGATTRLTKDDVIKSHVEAAKILYLEGYLFDSDDAKAAFVKAAEIAQAAGNEVALTLSDDFCVHNHRASFQHLVDNHVDILFANETELLSLYEQTDFETALKILGDHSKTACITRSEKGSVILSGGARYDIPVMAVDNVVDSTGAGDQYAAGVLAGRCMDMTWAEAGRLGSLCAAEVISHIGARPETPIKSLMAKAGL